MHSSFSKTKTVQLFTIHQLLSVQAHIGNKTSKWNPLTKGFLFGSHQGIHIFNLKVTTPFLKRLLSFLTKATQNHQILLFVGSHPLITILIQYLAESSKQASITRRWISGTLTNWLKIRPYIKFLYTTTIAKIKKKFILRTEKKIEQKIIQYLKMKNLFQGMERMTTLPNVVILFDQNAKTYAFLESYQLGLPLISLINSGPKDSNGIAYPIFGNDLYFDTLFFYTNLILQAMKTGTHQKRLFFLKTTRAHFGNKTFSKSKSLTIQHFKKKQNSKIDLFFNIYKNYKIIALKRTLRKSFYMFNQK